MDEFIKLLDNNLQYINHELINNTIYVEVASTKDSIKCPYCEVESKKVYSHYKKSFQDLPIQGYKVMVTLNNRKMFCNNPHCSKKTFAEPFDFLLPNAKKSQRLDNEIINISINVSSVTASKVIKSKIANVGKSTICNL